MTESEKVSATLKGVVAIIIELVDALAAGNPGLAVSLEERIKAQINEVAEADDEESFYIAMVPQMVLRKLQMARR